MQGNPIRLSDNFATWLHKTAKINKWTVAILTSSIFLYHDVSKRRNLPSYCTWQVFRHTVWAKRKVNIFPHVLCDTHVIPVPHSRYNMGKSGKVTNCGSSPLHLSSYQPPHLVCLQLGAVWARTKLISFLPRHVHTAWACKVCVEEKSNSVTGRIVQCEPGESCSFIAAFLGDFSKTWRMC